MGLIDHDEIPRYELHLARHAAGEVHGNDDDSRAGEGCCAAFAESLPVRSRIEDDAGKMEFLREFHAPLFAERCRADDQQLPATLGPTLAQHQTRLDGLAEADPIGQQHAFR